MARRPPVVPGFRASGVRCGIKRRGLDLALLVSDAPAAAAGVFTRSTVVGAPVALSRERVRAGRARAVVVNSGVSNVATGARGQRDARQMSAWVARALGCPEREVLVASTGVIGQPLPMPRLRLGIPRAVAALAPDGLPRAAEAILTTDTQPKWASTRVRLGRRVATLAGCAKGAGMIEPDMATMLAFVLTDAAVAAPTLRRLLREACEATFNRVTVDGETSTSDTLLLLASGRAGNRPLRGATSPEARAFAGALGRLCAGLARAIARDGEGATKLVTVRVTGARDAGEAEQAARRVANSLLVKTAVHGADPNWGRILQTIGAGRLVLDLRRAEVRLGGVSVYRAGVPAGPAARRRAAAKLRREAVEVHAHLGVGRGQATLWTCDLSPAYVRINAEYTT